MDLGIAGTAGGGRGRVRAGSGSPPPQALAAEGVQVAICGRDRDDGRGRGAGVDDASCRSSPTSSTPDGAARFVRDARDALGGIDILVANAGGPPPRATSPTSPTRRRMPRAFELNCLSTIAMCNEAVPDDAGTAVGARAWRSRRSRCASRSRT